MRMLLVLVALVSLKLTGCAIVTKNPGCHASLEPQMPRCEKGRLEPAGPHRDEIPTPIHFFGIYW